MTIRSYIFSFSFLFIFLFLFSLLVLLLWRPKIFNWNAPPSVITSKVCCYNFFNLFGSSNPINFQSLCGFFVNWLYTFIPAPLDIEFWMIGTNKIKIGWAWNGEICFRCPTYFFSKMKQQEQPYIKTHFFFFTEDSSTKYIHAEHAM